MLKLIIGCLVVARVRQLSVAEINCLINTGVGCSMLSVGSSPCCHSIDAFLCCRVKLRNVIDAMIPLTGGVPHDDSSILICWTRNAGCGSTVYHKYVTARAWSHLAAPKPGHPTLKNVCQLRRP